MSSFYKFFGGGRNEAPSASSSSNPAPPPAASSGASSPPSRPLKVTIPSPTQHQHKKHGHSPHKKHGHTTSSSSSSSSRSTGSSSSKARSRSHNGGDGVEGSPRKAAKWGGNISPQSASALTQLESYAEQLMGLEHEVDQIEAGISSNKVERSTLLEMKDQVAQLNGTLERLQYVGVDSIITAELDTGKELAKEKRKALNQRCDRLRDRILACSAGLVKLINISPTK